MICVEGLRLVGGVCRADLRNFVVERHGSNAVVARRRFSRLAGSVRMNLIVCGAGLLKAAHDCFIYLKN